MCKTVKSKLLEFFNLDPITEEPKDQITLVDMGLNWRLAIPTLEDCESRKRDDSEYPWSDYLDKICSDAMLMLKLTYSSASRLMSMIVKQQNIQTSQMLSSSLKKSSQELLSSTNSWSTQETR